MTASTNLPQLVIGGGVVGLHAAIALASQPGHPEIFLLEKEKFLGDHTSSRNSEVIHAGFAYPKDSNKAKWCVEGNRLTYQWLDRLKVPYKRCGKWLVAFNEQEVPALTATLENGEKCGVGGMRPASLAELRKKEPGCADFGGVIFSETSGMMDAASYLRALERCFAAQENCMLIYPCAVTAIHPEKNTIETTRGPMEYSLLVNCGGLFADEIYKMAGGKKDYRIKPFKGEYMIWRKGPIQEVIYPVPRRFLPGGDKDKRLVSSMGVHLHRGVGGDLYVGPTQVELDWSQKTDYNIVTPPQEFALQASQYTKKEIPVGELEPAYAGNRPKLYIDGNPYGDFLILREKKQIHILGTDSPGLTAAPAIAQEVLRQVSAP
ncbi:MAG: NAD(P)/FAD-dependent oxidoreductase [Deltaproteobacteria bacterium]|nr:NAD(P)/FAD-dependent oxidoreductase [Deltaproteobacteria bacterium]